MLGSFALREVTSNLQLDGLLFLTLSRARSGIHPRQAASPPPTPCIPSSAAFGITPPLPLLHRRTMVA